MSEGLITGNGGEPVGLSRPTGPKPLTVTTREARDMAARMSALDAAVRSAAPGESAETLLDRAVKLYAWLEQDRRAIRVQAGLAPTSSLEATTKIAPYPPIKR